MRRAFVETLCDLAGEDPRVFLLTGDLGFSVLERFAARFPDRFVNVGVAEQNLIGLAAGLAEGGFLPFAYSIATFASMRPYEMLRGAVLQGLPLRVVGVGGGFEYATGGVSHHALEDLALMRAQPGLRVVAPADAPQAAAALRATWDDAAPVYYRLGKDEDERVPGLAGRFGGLDAVAQGDDVVFLAVGPVAVEARRAAELLGERGVRAGVLVVSELGAATARALARRLACAPLALAVEEHHVRGGLGSFAAEVLAGTDVRCRLVRAGVEGRPGGEVGSRAWLRRRHGLDAASLAARVLRELQDVGPAHAAR